MELIFCPVCGEKLEKRQCGIDGMIPFCVRCKDFRFPVFSVAVSMIVLNPKGDKTLLIKQYGNDFYILTAGYVNKGESAENAVKREIKEELGLGVTDMKFNSTEYFEKSQTLIDGEKPNTNSEIDSFSWFSFKEAKMNIKKNSLAEKFLTAYLDEVKK